MVKRLIFKFLIENGAQIGKSIRNAYTHHIKNAKGPSKQGEFYKQTFGRVMAPPMSNEEAKKILSVPEETELTPEDIFERYKTLVKKNNPADGGSFYLQSKVYWAKAELMKDFPKFKEPKFDLFDEEEEAAADKGKDEKKN
eukprot:CAMPEP_0115006000 /NCGR_PEP_ID=MMETSP0216-20121206/20223_1 /TAXON_ID=223996 /ORGANISM="Protocruzia adherens, Strain Boccale" /LENGTH=140 /DNA_ID=CAMNT_0002372467 /DNA_START=33 /DNA_END=455 /DNA_ORIENTATION=+